MGSRSNGVRLLIGLGSVAGFLGGWVLLAHAPKPIGDPAVTTADVAAPAPEFLAPRGLQLFGSLPGGMTFPKPHLRTRGS